MASKRLKRRPKLVLPLPPNATRQRADVVVHDRRATDIPRKLLVGSIIVDDPYAPGSKIEVYRVLRGDPLAALHQSGSVDDAMFIAGRRWQRAFELSEIGGAQAIDTTKEPVDGGFIPEPFTDAQRKAVQDLAETGRLLGMEGESIVRDVLGMRMTIRITAARRGLTTEAEVKYIGRRFRECLESLAMHWGYVMRPDSRSHYRALTGGPI